MNRVMKKRTKKETKTKRNCLFVKVYSFIWMQESIAMARKHMLNILLNFNVIFEGTLTWLLCPLCRKGSDCRNWYNSRVHLIQTSNFQNIRSCPKLGWILWVKQGPGDGGIPCIPPIFRNFDHFRSRNTFLTLFETPK